MSNDTETRKCNAGQAISASSLFHFTKEFETFKKIIQNGLRFSYAAETFSTELVCKLFSEENTGDKIYFPMLCFCDTPLTRCHLHSKNYGEYMIGIKKEYFNQYSTYNLNPVFYLTPENLKSTLISITELLESNKDLWSLLSYIKPTHTDKRNYYDEREWRMLYEQKGISTREDINEHMTICTMDFKYISHIVVKDESEIDGIVELIDESPKLFGCEQKITKEQRLYLISKITSFERICQDY